MHLAKAIEDATVAAAFADDVVVGTSTGENMSPQAAEASLAIVVLSRAYLTEEWPMNELNTFLANGIEIYPLYYGVTPDELSDMLAICDRQASCTSTDFRLFSNSLI